jgi:diaminopimelate epimerase
MSNFNVNQKKIVSLSELQEEDININININEKQPTNLAINEIKEEKHEKLVATSTANPHVVVTINQEQEQRVNEKVPLLVNQRAADVKQKQKQKLA